MSSYFPPDKALTDKAAAKLRKILGDRSFMERWEPISQELKWILQGRQNADQHEMILPEYCYHIFDLYVLKGAEAEYQRAGGDYYETQKFGKRCDVMLSESVFRVLQGRRQIGKRRRQGQREAE